MGTNVYLAPLDANVIGVLDTMWGTFSTIPVSGVSGGCKFAGAAVVGQTAPARTTWAQALALPLGQELKQELKPPLLLPLLPLELLLPLLLPLAPQRRIACVL